MSSPTDYEKLEAYFLRLYHLQHLQMLAQWDISVVMPPKGAEARGNALAELNGYVHELLTDPQVNAWLKAAETASADLSLEQQANVREMRRRWRNENALSDDFVQRKARLTTRSGLLWAKCRANNDFAAFLPTLKEIVALVREEAQYRSAFSGCGLYESLFHMYESGMSVETLEHIFDNVKSWLPELLRKILANSKDEPEAAVALQTPLPLDKQEALSRHMMEVWGFDFEAGRMDVSAHPFTGMAKEDTRITTNYVTDDYDKALFATIHETNHAKYEQNCGPRAMLGQPVCDVRTHSIDESQALFAEKTIARSSAFAEFLVPILKEFLGDQPAFTVDNVRLLNQKVKPGFIRIYADEVCYPLHVILRYEMERDLIEGRMEVEDIPRVWNEKMKEYLGLDTEGRDDIGCLQDIHWSQAKFGYFPTYSLGAMFAAQLMAAIKRELGEDTVRECIRTGNLEPIFAKQKEKIWDSGRLYETDDLVRKATGESLDPKYFREHLERRYLRKED
jgi:carboxypeptidase Taq